MNILIAGGTGFIGNHITNELTKRNNQVFILTRNVNKYADSENVKYVTFDVLLNELPAIDVVINLAGESLFGYWTKQKKEAILQSRLETTSKLIELMKRMDSKPKTFISASAIGYYGTNDDKIFTEKTTEYGDDFLAQVTQKWESVAQQAEQLGIRTVYARFGIVLDRENGALPLMALPVKSLIGGKIGNGKQWMSWIHIVDCVNLLLFTIDHETISGPLNITAPNPKRNDSFTKILGKTLRRPTLLPAPKSIIKLALGEMSLLITEGQYVYPQKALDNGFHFEFPNLYEALQNIFEK